MTSIVTVWLRLCCRYTVSSGRLDLPLRWRNHESSSSTPPSTSSTVDPPVGTSAATSERQSAMTRWTRSTMESQEGQDDLQPPPLSFSRSINDDEPRCLNHRAWTRRTLCTDTVPQTIFVDSFVSLFRYIHGIIHVSCFVCQSCFRCILFDLTCIY